MKTNFLKNTYKGIKGVTIIDSGKEGKNIGVFSLTHGNEPVGIEVMDYLVNIFDIQKNILVGKIFFISVNIEAYEKYILQDDFLKFRFIDHNMNRIYKSKFIQGSYEFERFEELKTIFDEIDIVIDLHSVPSGNDIIGITEEKYLYIAEQIFDVENILIGNMSKSGAMTGYFIDKGKIAFGLECGNHVGKKAYINGVKNILNLLSYFGIINYKYNKVIKQRGVFRFINEIFPKTLNFKYSKNYINFDKIGINEIYAIDNNYKFINTFDKDIYIVFVGKNSRIGDGNGFLLEKIINL